MVLGGCWGLFCRLPAATLSTSVRPSLPTLWASTREAAAAVHPRRGHILRHTSDALYREDATALAVSEPCASDAAVGREDDACP